MCGVFYPTPPTPRKDRYLSFRRRRRAFLLSNVDRTPQRIFLRKKRKKVVRAVLTQRVQTSRWFRTSTTPWGRKPRQCLKMA